jgi:hypothetical protein
LNRPIKRRFEASVSTTTCSSFASVPFYGKTLLPCSSMQLANCAIEIKAMTVDEIIDKTLDDKLSFSKRE